MSRAPPPKPGLIHLFSPMPVLPSPARGLSTTLLLAFSLVAANAPAQDTALPPLAPDAMIGPVTFGEITVDAAIEMLERWSDRTVLRPNGLPATNIPFSLKQKITREEARRALETILTLNGIAVTPLGGKFLKVVPLATAKGETPSFIEGSTLGLAPSGEIASKLFQLQFLRIGEFMPQIGTMLNPAAGSPPMLFEKANAALLTDTISNLQRVEKLLVRLDQPALEGLAPKFYPIRNSTASALVTRLQSLLSGNAATQLGTGTSYQADDRTNQIILISDARQHAFFDGLIAQLDSEGESSTRQEVLPLKHANATELATLLSSLISGQTAAASRTGSQTGQLTQAQLNARNSAVNTLNNLRYQALPTQQAAQQPGGAQGSNAANRAAQQAAPAQAAAPIVVSGLNPPGAPAGAQETQQQFSAILTVVPDERSNALVVSGTVEDLRLIRTLVTQLDVLLAQVRIEVVIAEITLDDTASTGIDALGLVLAGDKLVGFSGSGPGFDVSGGTVTRDPVSGGIDLAGTLSLGTTPRKNNTNILSVPNIVTTHNKLASIFVGESFPVITSYQNTGTTTGAIGSGFTSTVTYLDIGILLAVTPLIGNDGSVQLEIRQQVDDVVDSVTIDGNSQPVIGSRTTESFVSARSGEIVVLGGLQRKTRLRSTSRFAGLPLVGDLLGARSRSETRTDLVFFLRPVVLTNTPADNQEAFDRLQGNPEQQAIDSALQGRLSPTKR